MLKKVTGGVSLLIFVFTFLIPLLIFTNDAYSDDNREDWYEWAIEYVCKNRYEMLAVEKDTGRSCSQKVPARLSLLTETKKQFVRLSNDIYNLISNSTSETLTNFRHTPLAHSMLFAAFTPLNI